MAKLATVNPNGIKTILASVSGTFFIKGKAVFSTASRSLPIYTSVCPILRDWVFDNFILADELFENALHILETYVWVTNDLWEKLVPSLKLPVTFDERFKVISVPFFILDFDLLSCELDNLTIKMLHRLIL